MSLYAPKEKKKKEKPTDDVQGTPSGFEYGLNFGCINGCSISLKSDGWVGGECKDDKSDVQDHRKDLREPLVVGSV